ncbi:ATP-dependent nuclease [Vibrio splendidus]|uniref:ATP-dependent nuclease n=1 Tax=Vibrio splendidus TaxID=29497 RepID=UPI000D38FC59|nr:AAA family ATPase [Vibrio splendidus]PTP59498.1 ATP-dependent endonuclease [Vibrio splendidus]
MKTISKIELKNYRRFTSLAVDFHDKVNILIGDNESGKSSILEAIELTISGSRHKVETIGIDRILSKAAIQEFWDTDKTFARLPKIRVEVFLEDTGIAELNGRNNTKGIVADGIQMVCEPDPELAGVITTIIGDGANNFPYEFYKISFRTFADIPYTGYNKWLKYLSIDSSQINNEHATREYIKNIYSTFVEPIKRVELQNNYRRSKSDFTETSLNEVNQELGTQAFIVNSSHRSNLENDLTITEDNIPIESRGKGKQCFIKTEFALSKIENNSLDALLLEEPENHLSQSNMRLLVDKIQKSQPNQLFIATHSDLICTRLDLRYATLLNSNSTDSALPLKDLPKETAGFFMKAPNTNILEFVLSKKVILVEGNAEYILLPTLYTNSSGSTLNVDSVHVISVGGTSFKRYLDIAKVLGIKVAVIRDNDKNGEQHCVQNYTDYIGAGNDNMKVFFDADNEKHTFEVCIYNENSEHCDSVIRTEGMRLGTLEWMLKNKAEASHKLSLNQPEDLVTPAYIREAIEWIRE